MATPKDIPPKMWGKSEFWGLSALYDPDWCLTECQKKLRASLIELCRIKMRPHAIHCDKTYTYPRENLDALASLGLLGLLVPKSMGGLGETNQCLAMVSETIARYGCPSTAMIYTMHTAVVATLLYRHHHSPRIVDLLKRLDRDKLVGTLSYSDPATGGHFWFHLSSKARMMDDNTVKLLKYGSWATSAGFADFYAIQTVSPDFGQDYSNMSVFLVYKDEIRANTDDWSALGMHGNQSGPLIVEGIFSTDRLVGPFGDGAMSNDECVDPYFLLCSSSCWNGIALACMDLVKKHVTRKSHADVAMRVCDYPTIQDYFGDAVAETNTVRSLCVIIAQGMDAASENNDWSKHIDLEYAPRCFYLPWLWQLKYTAAKNCNEVVDTMLHAMGGSGYKTEFGLERLLRDGKAGWVMGPSNEVLRQFIGKTSLMGMDAIDYWDKKVNERSINHELGKMNLCEKKKLAERLALEVAQEETNQSPNHPFQDTDFENPFNTCTPHYSPKPVVTPDGKSHQPALKPSSWIRLKLHSKSDVTDKMSSFVFDTPQPTDYTGLLAGQYLEVQVMLEGRANTRFFSPVSPPEDFGRIELVMRFETSGIMSKYFKSLQPGDMIEFRGPSGGFEYFPNSLELLTLVASGGGITPALQIIRAVMEDKRDNTRIKLVYYSDTYSEILYRDELDSYAEKDPRLDISHTLGEVPENWDGGEGFIDTGILDREVDRSVPAAKHKIVLCGGPTMAVACLHSLRTLQVASEQIFLYGQFGVEQMKTVYGKNVKLSGHRSDNVL
uniref:Acyl-CoA dehydrogenase n=1 Tax=Hirondellea gigas TaxID=1518452 RepID=A0A2P2I086_9CRUS